ncbi:MAG: AI-2E family transporter [Ignavibacteriales bacterium]|nr:AI-2E family transporter [Ignavibacteriales bacterium]
MKKPLNDPTVKFFITILGLFIIFFVLKELQHIFIPLVIAYIMFFFFEPLNNFIESKKIPIPIVIFIDLFLTVSMFYGISKGIVDRFVSFSVKLPMYEAKLNHIISTSANSLGLKNRLLTHFDISKIIQSVDIGVLASGVFSSTLTIAASILLILFFFIFINTGHNKIFEAIRMRYVEREVKSSLKQMKKELKSSKEKNPESTREEAIETLTIQRELKLQKTFKDITEQVQRYIVTKFLISLSVGLLVGIILWLFKIEFFIIWAAFAILLNFIPNVGSVFAVIMPTLMALVQYESFGYAAVVAAVLIVAQNIIGNIIEPKIFGDRLGLNPLVILLSLLLWGYIWGIVGMFLAVPLTAIGKIILSNSSSKNLRFITNLMSN